MTPQPPKVSVCVVAYNQARFIGACLDSLLAQDCSFPYEIIVSDDASKDGTADIVRDYARRHPGRIVPLLQAKNLGPTCNLLTSHAAARADLVAHMDGDDLAYPSKLREQVALLEANPDCTVVVHDVDLITPEGASTGRTYTPDMPTRADLAQLVQRGAYFAHSSKMYRRSASITTECGKREVLDLYAHVEHASSGDILGIRLALGAYRLGTGVTTVREIDEPILQAHRDAIQRAAELGCDPRAVERGRLRVEYRAAFKQLNRGDKEAFRRLIRLRGREYRVAPWRHVAYSLLRNRDSVLRAYGKAVARRVRRAHERAARADAYP